MAANPFDEFQARYAKDWVGLVREVLGIEPDPFQAEMLDAACKGERRIAIRSGHGVGKGHPVETRIDTPDGVRRWGDLRVGDRVFGTEGDTRVIGVYPRGTLPVYRVTLSDGSSTVVDGDHRWTVHERRGVVRTLDTRQMVAEGTHRKNGRGRAAKWRLPTYRAVDYAARPPFDPYLFGYWLGDGSKGGTLTAATSVVDKVPGVRWRPSSRPTVQVGTVTGLSSAIRNVGLGTAGAPLKFVPAQYKYTTAQDRHALLQGLLDTDGTADKRGVITFCSTSRRLAEDVIWLVRSLGGIASLHPTPKKPYYRTPDGTKVMGLPAHNVSLVMPDDYPPFRLPFKAERIRQRSRRGLSRYIVDIQPEGTADVMCIAVAAENSLYLANDFIATHNTLGLSCVIVCHSLTRFPQATLCTAPTSAQLFDALARQTKALFKKLPKALAELFEVKVESIDHKGSPEESLVSFRTSKAETPEALAGFHEGNILLIADEASGIPEAVFVAALGSMSGHNATMILAGNPVRTSGLFFDVFNKPAVMEMWRRIHVSCLGHPRVTDDFVAQVEAQYGRDTNDWRVRVLGEFPLAEADAVIPYDLIQAALVREVTPGLAKPIWGLDCARFGSDRSVLVSRSGNVCAEKAMVWKDLDTMQLVGRVKAHWDATSDLNRPTAICVDAIGLGAGVADRLRELGLPALAINVSEASALGSDQYANLRAELYIQARDWFASRAVKLGDDILGAELSWPRRDYTSNGRMKVEAKDQLKKRMKKSPDLADAFVLTFAAPATSALYGSSGNTTWNQPLTRELKCLV